MAREQGRLPGVEFTRDMRSKEELGVYLAGLRQDWQMIYYKPDEFYDTAALQAAMTPQEGA